MAMESACLLQMGKDRYEGRVCMEADHIDFSGKTKFRFRLTEITQPRQEECAILFGFHGYTVNINLGQVRSAEQWIDYILHPRSLADKLGVKDGHTIRLMNIEDNSLLSSLNGKKAKLVSNGEARCDMVMLGVERAAELRQLEDLSENLRPDGAIWVVLPKSVRTVTKANVFAAAREAGMVPVEVVDFSETQAAHKIVRNGHSSKRSPSKTR